MSNPQSLADLGLGPIDQVAYIVEDMERAIPRYEALFGPFTVTSQKLPDCTVRGRSTDLEMKMAVNHSSPVEIELIQPVSGKSPWTEQLESHGEGIHHVRFRVPGIDEKLADLGARGFETLMYKRFGPEVAFAYLQVPEAFGGHVIELLELPGRVEDGAAE